MNPCSEKQSVCLKVNEKNLIDNLAYSFTNSSTVILELVQNARRSGATKVQITYSKGEKKLSVLDDGCGIKDFSTLLHVAESGWTDEIKDEEKPFGLGFLSALYASKRLKVHSFDKVLCCDTAELLNFSEVEIEKGVVIAGTQVELYDVEIDMMGFKAEYAFAGYPIPVIFNGKTIERTHALDAKDKTFMSTDLGMLYIQGLPTSEHPEAGHRERHDFYSGEPTMYYQGFPIRGKLRNPILRQKSNIIHVDSKRFQARMPDRETLYDQSFVETQISWLINEKWEVALRKIKSVISQEKFCDWYPIACHFNQVGLFDDIDYLPAASYERVKSYPVAGGNDLDRCLETGKEHIPREQLKDMIVFRSMDPADPYQQCEPLSGDVIPKDFAPWMFLYNNSDDRIILNTQWSISSNHWAYGDTYSHDDIAVHIEHKSEPKTNTEDSGVFGLPIVFCSQIDFFLKGKHIEADKENAMVLWSNIAGAQVVIPEGESYGNVVTQANTFPDDCGEFDEDRAGVAIDMMEDFLIHHQHADNPKDLMDGLIKSLKLEKFPTLKGTQFEIKVTDKGICVEQM